MPVALKVAGLQRFVVLVGADLKPSCKAERGTWVAVKMLYFRRLCRSRGRRDKAPILCGCLGHSLALLNI